MKKALASFGTGDAAKTLAIALPTFQEYADLHGYDLITDVGDPCGRPAPWGKITLLQRLLGNYDFVLWVDADAIIFDGSVDIESVIPPDAFQAYVLIDVPGAGSIPSTGVWALRAGARAQDFLRQVWAQEDLIHHSFWEQAPVQRLVGWTLDAPFRQDHTTEWSSGTFHLPSEWDVVPEFAGRDGRVRILHYSRQTTARRVLEMNTDLAQLRGRRLRYLLGASERRLRRVYRPVLSRLRRRGWLFST